MYPVLFTVFGLPVYTYGFLMAIALLCSIQFSIFYAKKLGISEEKVQDLAIVVVLTALFSARLTYVVQNWHFYEANMWKVFAVWEGGLVFFGGFLGGVFGGVLYWYWKGENVLQMGDIAFNSISLGQAIGRLGCFFYGCCYGIAIPENSPLFFLGVKFPGHTVFRHPTQLYSSAANLLIFLMLLYIRKKTRINGMVIVSYFYIYGLFRFLIEIIRDDERGHILGITSLSTSQTIAIGGFIFAVFLHYYIVKHARKNNIQGQDSSAD
jgi:phosphatidylglycerol:prolipoprotein diacylglycerol transferase